MTKQSSQNILLQVNNISKFYTDSASPAEVLHNISLDVYENDFICVLGPSGCGKTTFLRCVAGFETYDGEVTINGNIMKGAGPERMMVFQDFNQLFPWLTVQENITFPMRMNGHQDKGERNRIADSTLEMVRLEGYGNYYPHQLSGGMKQRVAIAKALALKPKIILMDEPFASLDAITRRNIQKTLLEVKEKSDITILFVTHSIQEAITLSNRIVILDKNGAICVNQYNPLPKPVTPASPGYAELWDFCNNSIMVN